MDDANRWIAEKLYGEVDDDDKRFNYRLFVFLRGVSRLFRILVFCAGVIFLIAEQWIVGLCCFLYLLWWRIGIIQSTLEQILFMMRGFTDDQLVKSIRNGEHPDMKGVLGTLHEIAQIMREIRNRQVN